MKPRQKTILLHLIGWIIFLSMPHLIFGIMGGSMHRHLHDHIPPPPPEAMRGINISIFFFNSLLIAFYYINSLVLIPRLLARRRRIWYIVSIIGFMLLLVGSPSVISFWAPSHLPPIDSQHQQEMITIRILFSILLFAIIFIVSTGIRIITEWYGAEQQTKQILLEKTTAELSFLKAQVNPHFLFNTLNNIYSLSVKKSESTPDAILLLADMMRYVLSDAQNDHVPLAMETAYISQFIELQKLRLTDMVTIDYSIAGDTEADCIAPLILIPFIENAFKFGISTHAPSTISVSIDIHTHIIKMKVVNKLFPQTNIIATSSGIGLVNVKRRLSLLYPDRYRLQILPDDDQHYIISLEINLGT